MDDILYTTGICPDGKPLVSGLFTIKDQCGFPLDAAFEECKQRGVTPDIFELLCAAWVGNPLGFDAIVRELDLLGGSHIEEWKRAGAMWLIEHPGARSAQNPVDEFCRAMLARKRGKAAGEK